MASWTARSSVIPVKRGDATSATRVHHLKSATCAHHHHLAVVVVVVVASPSALVISILRRAASKPSFGAETCVNKIVNKRFNSIVGHNKQSVDVPDINHHQRRYPRHPHSTHHTTHYTSPTCWTGYRRHHPSQPHHLLRIPPPGFHPGTSRLSIRPGAAFFSLLFLSGHRDIALPIHLSFASAQHQPSLGRHSSE